MKDTPWPSIIENKFVVQLMLRLLGLCHFLLPFHLLSVWSPAIQTVVCDRWYEQEGGGERGKRKNSRLTRHMNLKSSGSAGTASLLLCRTAPKTLPEWLLLLLDDYGLMRHRRRCRWFPFGQLPTPVPRLQQGESLPLYAKLFVIIALRPENETMPAQLFLEQPPQTYQCFNCTPTSLPSSLFRCPSLPTQHPADINIFVCLCYFR